MNGFKTAGQRMPEVLDAIGDLPLETRKTARVLADVVGDPEAEWPGDRGSLAPGILATTCVYVADMAVRPDEHYSQEALCELAPGSHVTLRRNYQLIPQTFFANAETADLDRLSDEAVEVLQLFRDAERLGVKMRGIDPWYHSRVDDLGAEPDET